MISVTFTPKTLHEHALLQDFIAIYGRGSANDAPAEHAAQAEPEAPAPRPVPTLEELRSRLMSIPRDKALALLAQFGVPKLPALPVEKYEAFWTAMEAA